jgi:PRTRC genetic system ThiF family protein
MTEAFHFLPEHFFQREVSLHVVGCGGTGSQLVPRLAQLHKCMLALGHPAGLRVTVWDADTVSEHNCLRQNFYLPDVGHNKATAMVNRCNIANGLDWRAQPVCFSWEESEARNGDIYIGCVDSRVGRKAIDEAVRQQYSMTYWIDAGNDAASAQIVVGQYGRRAQDEPMRLPLVTELFPEIVTGEEDNAPSCSAFESLSRQGIATNAMAATWIYAWLAEAFKSGKIGWSGVFFNLETGQASSIPISRKAWDAIRNAA